MYRPTLLSWDEKLSTGNSDLDKQHKNLIEICNDIAVAIEKKRGQKIIEMVLDVLNFYTQSHFKKEEECMARYNCVAAKRNIKSHSAFIEKLKYYQSEHEKAEASEELAIKIHQYLSHWIINHILHVDTHLYTAIHHRPKPHADQSPLQ